MKLWTRGMLLATILLALALVTWGWVERARICPNLNHNFIHLQQIDPPPPKK